MDFDGSITPPLSDDENFDSCISASPVLSKKLRVEPGDVHVLIKGYSNDAQTIDQNGASKIDEAENGCYTKTLKCLLEGDEVQISKRFYQVLVALRDTERHIGGESFSIGKSFQKQLTQLLKDINVCMDRAVEMHSSEKLITLIPPLCMLCNEVSNIVCFKKLQLVKHTIEKFKVTEHASFLHHCKKQNLVEWMHSYSSTYTTLIELALCVCKHFTNISKLEFLQSHDFSVSSCEGVTYQVADHILYDMMTLAGNTFLLLLRGESINLTWRVFLKKLPLPCECYQAVYLKSISLLEDKQQFWDWVNTYITNLMQSNTASNPSTEKTDSCAMKFSDTVDTLSFIWWWTRSLLFSDLEVHGNSLLTRLIRMSLRSCGNRDGALGFHLLCYYNIIQSLPVHEWSASDMAPFNLLWHHYSQKMNAAFPSANIDNTKMERYLVKDRSLQEYLSACKLLCNFDPATYPESTIDSFSSFMCILSTILKKNVGNVWYQIKDRFFSRLQTSTMKQLNESGLEHFFTLVIILLYSAPHNCLNEILKKCMTLLDFCPLVNGRSNMSVQKLSVTGFFSLIHVCIERNFNFDLIAIKIAKQFTQICKLLCDNTKALHRMEIWKLFTIYFEYLVSCFQVSSSFLLGQVHLIPIDSVKLVFEHCRSHETNFIVSSTVEILQCLKLHTQHQVNSKDPIVALFLRLCQEEIAFLKKIVCSEDVLKLQNVDEILWEFTILSLTLNTPIENPNSFAQLWKYFANEGKVIASVRCTYLCTSLSSKELVIKLNQAEQQSTVNKDGTSLSDIAIQGWIKCCYVLPDDKNSSLYQLNRLMIELQTLKVIFPGDSCISLQLFIGFLSKKFSESQNFKERVRWSMRASSLFTPTFENALHNLHSPNMDFSTMLLIYGTAGTIVQHCSTMLYSSGKSSFVSKIFHSIIINPLLHKPAEKQAPLILTAIFKTLHKYIIGLLAMGQTSIFAKKMLKDIVTHYAGRWKFFEKVGNKKDAHPFLKTLLHPSMANDKKELFLLCIHSFYISKQPVESISVVVEILHFWVAKEAVNGRQLLDKHAVQMFLPLLQQARIQLGFSSRLVEKTNILLEYLRGER